MMHVVIRHYNYRGVTGVIKLNSWLFDDSMSIAAAASNDTAE